MPIPAIAIHGSGTGRDIARAVDANFAGSAAAYDRVVTLALDWDRMAPPASPKGLRNLGRFLRRHAANIGAASAMGMDIGSHPLDGAVGKAQALLHRLLQWVVAGLVTLSFATWMTELVVLPLVAWYGLPTVVFTPMQWMATGAGWLKSGLGGGIALLVGLSGLRLVLTMSPRAAIITFRSVVVLLAQPLLILLLAAFAVHWAVLCAFFGALGLWAYLVSGIGAALPWAAALGVSLELRTRWGRGPATGPIKVVFDAFRYLGEPDYRSKIQQALDKAVVQARKRSGEDREFVLAGQGMGTVIAVDSILHSRVWRTADRLLLVTMGSPLRRYFLRFFPRTLFPEYMQDLVDLAANRLGEIRWINIYRPGDYLGGDLGLKPFAGRDVTTGQRFGIIGHADYWRRMDARHAFGEGLQLLGPIEPLHIAMKDAVHWLPKPRSASAGIRIPTLVRTALWAMVAIGTFAWGLWWMAVGSGALFSAVGETPDLLEHFGVVVEATATHQREAVGRGGGLTYIHHWYFEFTDSSGTAKRLHVQHDVSDAYFEAVPHFFDHRALTQYLRDGCADEPGSRRWWPNQNLATPCSRAGVWLRYYPRDEVLLDLPDFPLQPRPIEPLAAWSGAGIAAAVLSALVLIPMVLGVRLFFVILG